MNKPSIISAMKLLNEEYAGKFTVSEERISLWSAILAEFEDDCILAAVTYLVSRGGEWPPVIGQIREMCLNMSDGGYATPSAEEAWLRVLDHVANKITLPNDSTDITALRAIGGSWAVRTSTCPDSTRSAFLKIYNSITQQRRDEKIAIPVVKNYVDGKRRQLSSGTKVALLKDVVEAVTTRFEMKGTSNDTPS